jgi:ATP-binding cassette, subfamily B, multidrug efflux pump
LSAGSKIFDLKVFSRLLSFASQHKPKFYASIFIAISLSVIASFRPYLTKMAIDDYVMTNDKEGLFFIVMVMLGVMLIEVLLQYAYVFLANWLGQRIIKDIRDKLFEHIISFKLKYFDSKPIGTLVTRVVSDIETIAEIFSQGLLMIISDVLKMAVVLGIMFYINVQLTLIVLAVLPILLYATRIFQKAVKSTFQIVRSQVSKLNSFVQEHISGMKIVQLFAAEEKEYVKFEKINKAHLDAFIKTVWYYSIFFPIAELLSSITLGLVVWYGGIESVTSKNVTLGELIAFINLIQMLFRPLRQIADKFNVLQMGMVASERIFEIFDTKSNIARNGHKKIDKLKGKIEFENVNFEYVKDHPVLKNMSFTVNPGETIAIVGSTGSGKSTIINIMNRFYEHQGGNVKIDGINIEDYNLDSLREQISIVLQDVFLFSDSILKNIILNKDIGEDEVLKAAKEIEIDEFIEKLPGKFHYNVKERGAMLSSGQKQLISFLRAYLSNPSILILDEATSSIDNYSEELIQKSTEKITQGRTSIIIAHRLSTIKNADRIMVIEKGEIIEIGSHEELYKKDGAYKALYEHQFAKSSSETEV